jgi:hypothetical protein
MNPFSVFICSAKILLARMGNTASTFPLWTPEGFYTQEYRLELLHEEFLGLSSQKTTFLQVSSIFLTHVVCLLTL